MADISISVTKDQAATVSPFDLTEAASSPGAGQIELRIDLTTQPATRRDVLLFLEKAKTWVENGGMTGIGSGVLALVP